MKRKNIIMGFIALLMIMVTMASAMATGEIIQNNGQDFVLTEAYLTKQGSTSKVRALSGVKEDTVYDLHIKVRNMGASAGSKFVEATFFDKDVDWIRQHAKPFQAFSVVSGGTQVSNCVNGENWQNTAKVTLNSGQTKEVVYRLRTPKISPGQEEQYIIYVGAFFGCGSAERMYRIPVRIADKWFGGEEDTLAHCTNRLQDQGETAFNCGDSDGDCDRCSEKQTCDRDSSCKSGLICTSESFDGKKRCAKTYPEKEIGSRYCSGDKSKVLVEWQTRLGDKIEKTITSCDYSCKDAKCVTKPVCNKESVLYCDGSSLKEKSYDADCKETIKVAEKCEAGCQGNSCLFKQEPEKQEPTTEDIGGGSEVITVTEDECSEHKLCSDGTTVERYCAGGFYGETFSCVTETVEHTCCDNGDESTSWLLKTDCESPVEDVKCQGDKPPELAVGNCDKDILCKNSIVLEYCIDGTRSPTGLSCEGGQSSEEHISEGTFVDTLKEYFDYENNPTAAYGLTSMIVIILLLSGWLIFGGKKEGGAL